MNIKILKELSELNGIPGHEKAVQTYIENEMKPLEVTFIKDHLGSLIAKKGTGGPNVMIGGHMDEVGLMVTSITEEGYVKFQPIGGWFSQVMLAQVWQITTRNHGIIYGITGVKPPHIIPADQRSKAIAIDSMYLDIGVANREEALKLGIEPGNMITPNTLFKQMGNPKYLMGKAWDNRIGSAVVLEVMKRLNHEKLNHQLFATFTVQEEVGLRGAKTASYVVEPKIAFAIDTGLGLDIPGGDPKEQTLGKGPQILLVDGGLIAHPKLRAFVIQIAKEFNIPYQEAYINGGRTDAGHMHLAHSGAAALSICIPTRNMHSHTSVIHYDDYENTVKLMVEVLKRLDEKTVENILFH